MQAFKISFEYFSMTDCMSYVNIMEIQFEPRSSHYFELRLIIVPDVCVCSCDVRLYVPKYAK